MAQSLPSGRSNMQLKRLSTVISMALTVCFAVGIVTSLSIILPAFLLFLQGCSGGSHSGSANPPAASSPIENARVNNTPTDAVPADPSLADTPTAPPPAPVPLVTIDGNVKFQRINGFEVTILAMLNTPPDGFGKPLPAIIHQLVNDFGFRYIKVREDLNNFEPVNDNDSPLIFNPAAYDTVFTQKKFVSWFQNLKAIHDEGAQIHLSSFIPPSWMRIPSDVSNRYQLDPSYPRPALYQEIVELWAAPLVYFRDHHAGTEVESIVVWNEATDAWSPFRFTQDEYIETVKALGERLQAENLNTRILISDNGFINDTGTIAKAVLGDPAAATYAAGIAYHTYDDFERVDPDHFIPALQGLAKDPTIAASGLELRMTEWAPTGTDPLTGQALVWAKEVYNCHVYGNTSVVDLWALEPLDWSPGDPSAVTEADGAGSFRWRKHIYALKQFAKYIEPGSRRIQATSPAAQDVFVTAYYHDQTGRFTIVMINRGTADDRVNFEINNIQGLTALDVIRTSASENTVILGPVSIDNNAFDYNIQGESITTFTGTLES